MQLICGNCYEEIKKIPDRSIDLIIIDPPYLYDSVGGGTSRISKSKIKQFSNLKKIIDGFDFSIFEEFTRILKKINIYIWCSKKQILPILNYWTNMNISWEILCWHKSNPLPAINNIYCPDTEYCIYIRGQGVQLYGNLETKRKWWLTPINQKDQKKWDHPTIKPLEIIEKLIINSSLENQVVLDCFMGSGTTGVACVRNNRDFIGIEIEEKYFEIAQQRILGTAKKSKNFEIQTLF